MGRASQRHKMETHGFVTGIEDFAATAAVPMTPKDFSVYFVPANSYRMFTAAHVEATPAGTTFDTATGILSGTPDAGVYSLYVTAEKDTGIATSGTFVFTVA